eukprot:7463417-Pyramimonas_sp.AAC.1
MPSIDCVGLGWHGWHRWDAEKTGYRSTSASALLRRTRHFIRPSNGHSSPGIKCLESLCMRITDLIMPGAPCYFIHGIQWENIPSILSIGLSCRADDTTKRQGI